MHRDLKWIWASIVLSMVFSLEKGFPILKISGAYLQKTGVYPYAVLALCTLLLYSKRGEVYTSLEEEPTISNFVIGGSLVLVSFMLPANEPPIWIFALLLLWSGLFTVFFGKAAVLPMTLLGIFGFAIAFPLFITKLGSTFPMATTIVLVTILMPFIPVTNQGQIIHFIDNSGIKQSYFIDAACSGSAALGVFLSIFFLMLLDRPLSRKRTGLMFVFGLVGTALQNIVRLVVLVFAGYFFGRNAVWTAHSYAGYVLFAIWFGVFVYIYMRQSRTAGYSAKHQEAALI